MNNEIPNVIIKTQYLTEIDVNFKGKSVSYDNFNKSLSQFNAALEETDIILKRVEVYSNTVQLSFITSAVEKIDKVEFKDAIKKFVTEYLNIPGIEIQSFKFDYLKRLKTLEYFKDNYHLVDNIEDKNLSSVYKAKM